MADQEGVKKNTNPGNQPPEARSLLHSFFGRELARLCLRLFCLGLLVCTLLVGSPHSFVCCIRRICNMMPFSVCAARSSLFLYLLSVPPRNQEAFPFVALLFYELLGQPDA